MGLGGNGSCCGGACCTVTHKVIPCAGQFSSRPHPLESAGYIAGPGRTTVHVSGLYKEPAGGSGPVEVVSAPRAELPLAFDSHFHWDRSLSLLRMDKHGTDFNSVCHISPVSRDRQVKVVGAVANLCDPQTYPSPKEVDGLRRQGVRTTVGLHPKAAGNVSPSELRALQELLKVPGW